MKKLLLVIALLCVSGIAAAQMNYDDAVAENDSFYGGAVNLDPDNEGLSPEELQKKTDSEMTTDVLYLKPEGQNIGLGIFVNLSDYIADYKMLELTYQLQQEGAGTHTRTMMIPTNMWYTTSLSDGKNGPLYRYTETAGADKNRWSVINFWRTGSKQLFVQKGCDHYCNVLMVGVVGIK